MTMVSKYFSSDELKCKCGKCGSTGLEMNPFFMENLDLLREDYFNETNMGIVLSSAYRCPQYNSLVSTTGEKGPHTTGRAVDIIVASKNAFILLKYVYKLNTFTGIGVSQKAACHFIHIDNLTSLDGFPRPNLWSY